MKPFLLYLFALALCSVAARAQTPADSSTIIYRSADIDTLRLLSDEPLKSPAGALLRSALLPGWGQLYNRAYIKSGVVVAVHGFLIYKVLDNNRRWLDLRKIKDPGRYDAKDTRNLYIWYTGLAYLLNLVDAYVDAYLFGFDDVIDLTWQPLPGRTTHALTLHIKL